MLKKINLASTILILLLLPSIMVCQTTGKANKNILRVPVDFPTIQDAINHANPGDVIYVYNGTFFENIIVNKSVTLIGQSIDSTILDGNGSGSVITITASNVMVKGFTIKNSGLNVDDGGILISTPSSNNVITGNKIIGNNYGIWLYMSTRNTVSDNLILGNRKGIALYTSSENILVNNVISENVAAGIEMCFSHINEISGNIISHNNYGMSILRSINNIYHNNFIENDVDVQVVDSFISWSYNGEGNYWSRYSGQDLNQDGIGDFPYVVTEDMNDPHPLMGRFFSFKTSLKEEEYNIDIISNSSILNYTLKVGETGSIILRLEVLTEEFTPGFIRCALPVKLMNNPLIVLVDDMEIEPKILNVSDTEYVRLYIPYSSGKHTVKIISSTVLGLYNELLKENEKLKYEFFALNKTYQELLEKYVSLQQNYTELNSKYWGHLKDYYRNMENIQNLTYVLMTFTAAFLGTIVYLSRQTRLHAKTRKIQ